MLNLRSFAKWVRGILDSEEAYNLPEDVYNDVIPPAFMTSVAPTGSTKTVPYRSRRLDPHTVMVRRRMRL